MEIKDYIVDVEGTLLDVAQTIDKNNSRCVIVIEESKVIGVISEGDLLRALLRGTNIHSPLRAFIQHGFVFLEERNMDAALTLFQSHGISLIPILNQSLALIDVITLNEMLARVKLDA